MHAIAPYGVLRRDALSQMTHSERWPEGGLDGALHAAVDEGVLEPLPFGFYRDRTRGDRADGARAERARR